MSYIKKYQNKMGFLNVVEEKDKGLKRARLNLLKLKSGESYSGNTANNEYGLIIISGEFNIKGKDFKFNNIKRSGVFTAKASGVYLPIKTSYEIESLNDNLEIAICSASCSLISKPVLIKPEDIREFDLGVLSWKRKAYFIIDERVDSENFFIGETFLSPGKWAFPPHRHDYDSFPEEVEMDEIYHYRLNPENGFGVQLLYNDDKSIDNAYTIRNGDTVIFPEGYHPVTASPADSLYILWFLAGKKRFFISRPDDNYSWIKNCENLLK
jgi:5-deoxy-glucuronate isomerase